MRSRVSGYLQKVNFEDGQAVRKGDLLFVVDPRPFEAALEVYLGSTFVNEFNYLNRTYRVTAQADGQFRQGLHTVANLKTRNEPGQMVPIGSVATFEDRTGPYRVARYNLRPAAELQGGTAPGFSTGDTLAAMERQAEVMGADRVEAAARQTPIHYHRAEPRRVERNPALKGRPNRLRWPASLYARLYVRTCAQMSDNPGGPGPLSGNCQTTRFSFSAAISASE